MEIKKMAIRIADLFDGYSNDDELGVFAYGGKLNIRPAYQREFIYKPDQQLAVIQSILNGFPLNTMYWADNDDGTYGMVDGQQRSLSICNFCDGAFSHNGLYIHQLRRNFPEIYEAFMNYTLDVYMCKGTKAETLEWFKIINTYGERLNDQELLNVNYTGKWLTSAKKYFSKTNCPAEQIGGKYLKGSAIRQDYLETVLSWISGGDIVSYMSQHAEDENAKDLVDYFNSVMDWVKNVFPTYDKVMKGMNWGELYNEYGEDEFDPDEIAEEIERLKADDDVTSCSGIYRYIFTRDVKDLSIRKFNDRQRERAYAKQKGICPICGEHFTINKMEADHIIPWSKGGKTVDDNLQMLCKKCNRDKSSGN